MNDEQKRKLMAWIRGEIQKGIDEHWASTAPDGDFNRLIESKPTMALDYLARRQCDQNDSLATLQTEFCSFKQDAERQIESLQRENEIVKRKADSLQSQLILARQEIANRKDLSHGQPEYAN